MDLLSKTGDLMASLSGPSNTPSKRDGISDLSARSRGDRENPFRSVGMVIVSRDAFSKKAQLDQPKQDIVESLTKNVLNAERQRHQAAVRSVFEKIVQAGDLPRLFLSRHFEEFLKVCVEINEKDLRELFQDMENQALTSECIKIIGTLFSVAKVIEETLSSKDKSTLDVLDKLTGAEDPRIVLRLVEERLKAQGLSSPKELHQARSLCEWAHPKFEKKDPSVQDVAHIYFPLPSKDPALIRAAISLAPFNTAEQKKIAIERFLKILSLFNDLNNKEAEFKSFLEGMLKGERWFAQMVLLGSVKEFPNHPESEFISKLSNWFEAEVEKIKIEERIEQLEAGLSASFFETKSASDPLQKADVRQLALWIEDVIAKDPTSVFNANYTLGKTVRDIHVDLSQHFFSIIASKEGADLKTKGGCSRVLSGVLLPVHSRSPKAIESIVQLTPLTPEYITLLERGARFLFALRDLPGVIRIRSFIPILPIKSTLDSQKGDKSQQHSLSVLLDRANAGTLADSLSPVILFSACHQLVDTMGIIHSRRIVHGDLKPENVLIMRDGVIKIADFGLAMYVDEIGARAPAFTRFRSNVYAAVGYTAPEIFIRDPKNPYIEDPQLTSELLKKVESWALGCFLYELYCRMKRGQGADVPDLEWPSFLWQQLYPSSRSLSPAEIHQIRTQHGHRISNPRKQMASIPEENRSREEHLLWVIYHLMRMIPEDRWSIEEAAVYLRRHP